MPYYLPYNRNKFVVFCFRQWTLQNLKCSFTKKEKMKSIHKKDFSLTANFSVVIKDRLIGRSLYPRSFKEHWKSSYFSPSDIHGNFARPQRNSNFWCKHEHLLSFLKIEPKKKIQHQQLAHQKPKVESKSTPRRIYLPTIWQLNYATKRFLNLNTLSLENRRERSGHT